jgi:hypothetical protein
MYNVWHVMNPDPNTKEGKFKWMYENLGAVADLVFDTIKTQCEGDGERWYTDDLRSDVNGKTVQHAIGARRSLFEAWYVAITELGPVGKTDQKQYTLNHHQDGPNDRRKGYHITGVFWICFVRNGMVYRLSFIFYSRNSVGCALERDRKWLQPAKQMLTEYTESLPIKKIEELTWDKLGETDVGDDVQLQFGVGETLLYRKVMSLPNPDANYSIGVTQVNRLITQFELNNGDYANYVHIAAMCYLLSITNAQWSVASVLKYWGDNPREFQHILADRTTNLLYEFLVFVMFKLKTTPDNASGIRFQATNCAAFKEKINNRIRTKKQLRDQIDHYIAILNTVNESQKYNNRVFGPIHKQLTETVRGIGHVCAVQFFIVNSLVGTIHTRRGRQLGMNAIVGDKSPFAKWLGERGCKGKDVDKTKKRLSVIFGCPWKIIENWGCKGTRGSHCCDFFVQDQFLYMRTWEGSACDPDVRFWRRKLDVTADNDEWEEINPRILNPRTV